MVLSNDMAGLIGFGCEAVLYGAYCVLFILSLTFLVWRRRTRDVNVPMVFATCILFFACTAHFGIEFNHFFITLNSTGVVGFANETPQLVVADMFISVCDFLGDMVLLYRCWLVWGRNYYIVIVPFFTAMGGLACIAELLKLLAEIDPNAPIAPAAIVPLGTAGYVLPLCTNIMITGLIVGRIWWTSRDAREFINSTGTRSSTGRHIQQAMSIVIESGALYLAVQLVFVVLFAIGHPAQAIVAVMATQIYGIAPTLILFRVGLGISPQHSTGYVNGVGSNVEWSSGRGGERGAHGGNPSSTGYTYTTSRFTVTDTKPNNGPEIEYALKNLEVERDRVSDSADAA